MKKIRRELLLCYIELEYGGRSWPYMKKFARDIGASYGAVYKWAMYEREPRRHMRIKIERKTRGYIPATYWTT